MSVLFGIDRAIAAPSLLRGARLGLVTNDAARLASDALVHSRVALRRAGVPIVRLFGPEHGLGAAAADGAAVGDATDTLTGLPAVSLYGARMRPTREDLAALDRVVFDIPDIGVRFYSYIWTLFHLVSACAEYGTPLTILDRPNPLGGDLARAEGPRLDAAFRSFIGDDDIPIRHALTVGELARYWQRTHWPACDLEVIACEGWARTMSWRETGLPFVPTSPAMPSAESVLCYPGFCLFEATNLSIGRGTDAPFQRVGAPWLDANAVLLHLSKQSPRGAHFDSESFKPKTGPYAGEPCVGIRVTVTDAAAFRPVATGLLILAAIIATHRLRFAWARYPTAANPSGEGHFERLVGRADIRARLDASPDTVDGTLVAEWTAPGDWVQAVAPALLY